MCEGRIREKPADASEARAFLASYAAGAPAETVRAVVVFDARAPDELRAAGVHRSRLWMTPIPAATIEQYVAEGACFKSAGALQVEHPLLAPYRGRVEGTDDSIRGLPLALMERLIRAVSRG